MNKDENKQKFVVAKLSGIRITPRKIGLLADLIRNESVNEAERRLANVIKRGAIPMLKLVASAKSSAQNLGLKGDLRVSKVEVGKGTTLKRFRAGSRGSPRSILKRTSNIKLFLSEENGTKN